MNTVSVVCAAALGFLLFGLGLAVSAVRGTSQTFIGHDADPAGQLHKLVRAHANTAEYAPYLAVIILYLGAHNPAPWVVWDMIAVTVLRYVFVAGMVLPATMARPNPLRFIGAAGTYFTGLALCVALVQGALAG